MDLPILLSLTAVVAMVIATIAAISNRKTPRRTDGGGDGTGWVDFGDSTSIGSSPSRVR